MAWFSTKKNVKNHLAKQFHDRIHVIQADRWKITQFYSTLGIVDLPALTFYVLGRGRHRVSLWWSHWPVSYCRPPEKAWTASVWCLSVGWSCTVQYSNINVNNSPYTPWLENMVPYFSYLHLLWIITINSVQYILCVLINLESCLDFHDLTKN